MNKHLSGETIFSHSLSEVECCSSFSQILDFVKNLDLICKALCR